MKKLTAILLTVIFVISLVACNSTQTPSADSLLNDSFIDPISNWNVYDDLNKQIQTEKDPIKRIELMHKAEDILMACASIIPLYYENDNYMQKPYLTNVYANSSGYKYFYNCQLSNSEVTLKANIGGEPSSLDPAFYTTMDAGTLLVNSFAGLYSIDKDGNTVPDLAKSFTCKMNDDGTATYTVNILDNLRWSNGTKLSAYDFEYSWKRASKTETGAYNSSLFSVFNGYPDNIAVTATNDNTLEFTLNNPCLYIETLLASPAFFPVHKASVEAFGTQTQWCENSNFVCNGPFVCASWNHNKTIVFTKNTYYHNADKINVDNLHFTLSENTTAIYKQYKSGEFDFIDKLPADSYTTLRSHVDYKSINIIGTNFLCFNVNSNLFNSKTPEESACIRNAVNILIDRAYIVASVGKSGQTVADSIIPAGIKNSNGGIFKDATQNKTYFDPMLINNSPDEALEKAKQYLEAAGFKFDKSGKLSNETPLVIKYLTDDNADSVNIAEIIKADLNQLGINLIINQVDWNTFISNRSEGNYDIVRAGFTAEIDDPIYTLKLFTSDSIRNYCQFGKSK